MPALITTLIQFQFQKKQQNKTRATKLISFTHDLIFLYKAELKKKRNHSEIYKEKKKITCNIKKRKMYKNRFNNNYFGYSTLLKA